MKIISIDRTEYFLLLLILNTNYYFFKTYNKKLQKGEYFAKALSGNHYKKYFDGSGIVLLNHKFPKAMIFFLLLIYLSTMINFTTGVNST